ncbi:hypothetical protein KO494_08995 [Lacinutrix sp. C3R15]|uniref:hypothetical protein n=1 Tax=Flavobacteriaceae TaxID=49546 RepID=UPI001C0987E2|nr:MULTISPECIES: hypothetical protein [Flavobacteriaceae]MBU2939673.1 hypothetical protein [Lacinutrix sp. C3R15]MDO6622988.1 hypothetical protein [Oceanihabitans sp. 1_MG-2023]
MSKAIKTGVIATILVYVLGVTYTYYSNQKFSQTFEKFDINKNGSIDTSEKSVQAELYLSQMAKRKTSNQAIIILIPVSILIGFICFAMAILFNKMKTIDDNEINYQ